MPRLSGHFDCAAFAATCVFNSYSIYLTRHLPLNGFDVLPIDLRHATRVETLPMLHRDPFDRLLAAQALSEGLTLVSGDAVFDSYGVDRCWGASHPGS